MIHEQPQGDVIITGRLIGNGSKVVITPLDGVDVEITATSGVIRLTSDLLSDATLRRLVLTLYPGSEVYGGTITFLPSSESETFETGRLTNTGEILGPPDQYYVVTDFIPMRGVSDVVITATIRVEVNDVNLMWGYDADKQPVRQLLPNGSYQDRHIIPDGSYAYIVVCSRRAASVSCVLVFE